MSSNAEQQTREPVATLRVHNGVAWIWAVWALHPERAQIVALCTSEEIAERYRATVEQNYPGAVFHCEEAPVDHAFAETDLRAVAWRAAQGWVKKRKRFIK